MSNELRIKQGKSLCSLIMLVSLFGCDSVDIGVPGEEDGPPKVVRIFLVDDSLFGSTDILESTDNPVVVAATNTFIQMRLVLNKQLSPEVDKSLTSSAGASMVRITSATAPEVNLKRYYVSNGTPYNLVPILHFFFPYGPAIALEAQSPLAPATDYTITLDPALIKSHDGTALAGDLTFTFRTSEFSIQSPDFSAAENAEIAPNQILAVTTNGDIQLSASSTVSVQAQGGAAVPVLAFVSTGSDPSACADNTNTRQLNIVRVSTSSAAVEWSPGDYTIRIEGVRDGSGSRDLRLNPGGDAATGSFRVSSMPAPADDPNALGNNVLPSDCN